MIRSLLLAITLLGSSFNSTTAHANGSGPKVWIAEIRGSINPATSSFLSHTLVKAEAERAEAVVIELDTPGGLVSSVREMAQSIDKSSVPVVVYVTPAGASATSAGALLSLAAHVSAMSPGSNIGAAHPVGAQGEDVQGAMGEKVLQDTAAFARGLAELRGRSPELADLIVSKSKSFTAQEAFEEKLIEILASSRGELLEKLDGRIVRMGEKKETRTLKTRGAQVEIAQMSLGQKILNYLANPNIATLLISIGMLLIYVEVSNPGITIAGAMGGILLLSGFVAFQLLPIDAGGMALVALGIALLLAEPFVVSHGALAAGGLLSLVLGILWVIDPTETSGKIDPVIWVPAVVTIGVGVLLMSWAAARTHTLVARTLAMIGGGARMGLSGYIGKVESVSESGLEGKALIRGETWNFTSKTPVHFGDRVEVVEVQGMKAVVAPASAAAQGSKKGP